MPAGKTDGVSPWRWAAVLFALAILLGASQWLDQLVPQWRQVSRLQREYPVLSQSEKNGIAVRWAQQAPVHWASYETIAPVFRGAVMISEDWSFFQHQGHDFKQIQQALWESWQQGRLTRGASTISQQVVKNLFTGRERTVWRKINEAILVFRLERLYSKEKILETYLNIAHWGEDLFGATAAAQFYFHKRPAEITPKEGAFLAMLLPNPEVYAHSFRQKELSAYAQETVATILHKMKVVGIISEKQKRRARGRRLSFEQGRFEAMMEEFWQGR